MDGFQFPQEEGLRGLAKIFTLCNTSVWTWTSCGRASEKSCPQLHLSAGNSQKSKTENEKWEYCSQMTVQLTQGKTKMVAGSWVRAVQEITIPRAGFEYPLSRWSMCPSLVCAVQAGTHSTSQVLWQRHPECLSSGLSPWGQEWCKKKEAKTWINQCLSFEVNSMLICLFYNLWCRYVYVTWCDNQRSLQIMSPETVL